MTIKYVFNPFTNELDATDTEGNTVTVIESYDTGWINRSDWTNAHMGSDTTKDADSNVTHTLNAPLSDLIVKVLISTDGTDANSFEIIDTAVTAANAKGINVYAVDNNNVKVQTGVNGIIYLVEDSGGGAILATDDWYYKIVVLRPITGSITMSTAGVVTANSWVSAGSIMPYAGSVAPTGWFLCNGAAVSRTVYSALFDVCGQTFGVGDGSTTFNVPDLRGIFVRGAGTSGKLDDAQGVAFAGILGTYQVDKFQGHYHRIKSNNVGTYGNRYLHHQFLFDGGSTHALTHLLSSLGASSVNAVDIYEGFNGATRQGDETNPANLGLTYIIKWKPAQDSTDTLWSTSASNTFLTNISQNVGIGTESPDKRLEVDGDAGYVDATDMGATDSDFASKKYVDDSVNVGIAEDLELSGGTKTQRVIYCKDLDITASTTLKARTIWVEGNLTIDDSVVLTISPLATKNELYSYGYHPGLFAPGQANTATTFRGGRGGFGGGDGGNDTARTGIAGAGGAGLIGDGGNSGYSQNSSYSGQVGGDGRNVYLNPVNYKGGNGGHTTWIDDGSTSGGGGGGCGGGSGGTCTNTSWVVSNGGTGAEMIFFIVRGNVVLGDNAKIISTGTNAEAQGGGNAGGAGGGAGGTIVLIGYGSSNSFGTGSALEAKGGNGGIGYNYAGGGGGGAGGIVIIYLKSSTFPTIVITGGSGGAGGITGSGGGNGAAGSGGYSNVIDMDNDTHTLNGGENNSAITGWIMQFIEGIMK